MAFALKRTHSNNHFLQVPQPLLQYPSKRQIPPGRVVEVLRPDQSPEYYVMGEKQTTAQTKSMFKLRTQSGSFQPEINGPDTFKDATVKVLLDEPLTTTLDDFLPRDLTLIVISYLMQPVSNPPKWSVDPLPLEILHSTELVKITISQADIH